MGSMRQTIERQVHQMVGFGSGEIDLDTPPGDPGLFGPGSAPWRVHADFTTMLVGGIGALFLQMLHPGALAGVWDHSNFREDMAGRLRRTAQFISGTTYGSREQALALIERVRKVHDRVHGVLPDGTLYSANDPALLTWVHVAEMHSFLTAYLHYRDPRLAAAVQDRYLAETATIAERLGATGVPKTRTAVDAYLAAMRPVLRANDRTRTVAAALLASAPPSRLAGPFRSIMMAAGIDLLPDWAAAMHGFAPGGARRLLARSGAASVGSVVRWALSDGSARRAERRMAAIRAAGAG